MNMPITYMTWSSVTAHCGEYWKELTPEEVSLGQCGEADLHGLLRRRYGINDAEVKRQIDTFLSNQIFIASKYKFARAA